MQLPERRVGWPHRGANTTVSRAPLTLPGALAEFRCTNPACSHEGQRYNVPTRTTKVVLGANGGTLRVDLRQPTDGNCPACGSPAQYVCAYYGSMRVPA